MAEAPVSFDAQPSDRNAFILWERYLEIVHQYMCKAWLDEFKYKCVHACLCMNVFEIDATY